ncbi:MAG TPA: preprotein translocase subunit YajC [Polyangia bacterium]|nr:preprotein translocase subunit YajC [Polyangia bacterium]
MLSLLILAQQSDKGGQQGGGSSPFSFIWMMLLMFGVVWFMMIRPQQKKAKEHQQWLKDLKKGDEVVTQGGIIGRITGLSDTIVTLEVQEKVRMRVLRSSIQGKPPESKKAQASSASEEKPAEEKK